MPTSPSRRTAIAIPLALAMLGLAGTSGGAAPAPAAAASPFFGRWQLDLARMPDSYGPPPKQVVFTFRDAGAGRWQTIVDIIAPDGSVRHTTVTYRPDGHMAVGEGDTREADSAAFMAPAPNVLVMNLGKNKAQGSVRVYTISADGRQMTESAANVDDKGEPFVRTFHFVRIA